MSDAVQIPTPEEAIEAARLTLISVAEREAEALRASAAGLSDEIISALYTVQELSEQARQKRLWHERRAEGFRAMAERLRGLQTPGTCISDACEQAGHQACREG